ncbi:MAG: RIP metalloprotease RseP [Paludibacter sp.]|nr:RIP metalloprotease RseP [Paludibacter sp.]MCM1575881.1 RIP metalloprotease RseP [Bacteroides sp.]
MSSTFLIRALQLILALSFLVVIHELGHFTFARIFGVRVEKFYMFFNPRFSLVRFKKINGKWEVRFFAPNVLPSMVEKLDENGQPVTDAKGKPLYRPMTQQELDALPEDDWRRYSESTEWGIGWLPLGGYCSIAGMVDETTAAGDLASEPQPWEYRAKPTWQRLPIIIGGVLVNFVAALIIYGAVLYHWGTEYLPLENADYGLQYSEVMLRQGFEQGDKIIRIGERIPETNTDVVEWLVVDGERRVTLLRNTDTLQITLPEHFDQLVLASGNTALINYRFPFVVEDLVADGPAAKALMMKGDSIISVGGISTLAYQDVTEELQKYACDSVTIGFVRNGEPMQARLYLGDEAKLGVYAVAPYGNYLHTRRIEYGFWQSIPAGAAYGWDVLVSYVKQFKLVFTKEGSKSLGGFGAIGSLFPPTWDWHAFWLMTAFLSIILAFMNIIPIPGLDGGHVFFLLWEMITRKKPSDRFLEIVNNIGFWLLLLLVLYANLNDILKLFI